VYSVIRQHSQGLAKNILVVAKKETDVLAAVLATYREQFEPELSAINFAQISMTYTYSHYYKL